jgi:hypothetical protein
VSQFVGGKETDLLFDGNGAKLLVPAGRRKQAKIIVPRRFLQQSRHLRQNGSAAGAGSEELMKAGGVLLYCP